MVVLLLSLREPNVADDVFSFDLQVTLVLREGSFEVKRTVRVQEKQQSWLQVASLQRARRRLLCDAGRRLCDAGCAVSTCARRWRCAPAEFGAREAPRTTCCVR